MSAFTPLQAGDLTSIVADPISLVLVALGALFVGFASLLFGYMALRGLAAGITSEPGRGPPRQAQ